MLINWNFFVSTFSFWGSGVGISSVGSVGLVGNFVSFVTIVTMKKRSLFINRLLTLTIFDIFFLTCGGLFFIQVGKKICIRFLEISSSYWWLFDMHICKEGGGGVTRVLCFLIHFSPFFQEAFAFKSDIYNWLFPKVIYPLAGVSMTGEFKRYFLALKFSYESIFCVKNEVWERDRDRIQSRCQIFKLLGDKKRNGDVIRCQLCDLQYQPCAVLYSFFQFDIGSKLS